MQVFISDNGETVVVIEGDQEHQYSIEEFISIYGVDALPADHELVSKKQVEVIQKQVEEAEKKYLNAFLDFLDACGIYIHLAKLERNASDGVYPVQVVAYNYGHVGHFGQELAERDARRWNKLRLMDAASQEAGYLPMDEEGMCRVMKFFEDSDRRRYARDNIRRMLKTGGCMSVADLMRKRYQVEKKNKEKEKAKKAQ